MHPTYCLAFFHKLLNKAHTLVATVWTHELMHVASIGKTDPQLLLPNMPDFEYGRDGEKYDFYYSQLITH
jgi:hypothetical protein